MITTIVSAVLIKSTLHVVIARPGDRPVVAISFKIS